MSAATAIAPLPSPTAPCPPLRPSRVVKRPSRRTPQGKARLLALEFEAKGWTFEQVLRKGTVCLYRKTKVSESGKMITSWEVVFPIVRRAQRLPGGSVCPHREVYPSDNDWGTRGWTYLSKEEASRHASAKSTQLHARRTALHKRRAPR